MEVRGRLGQPALPVVAGRAPHRAALVRTAAGRPQVLAWDRRTAATWPVADLATQATPVAVDPPGRAVWWFDAGTGGVGCWRTADFDPPSHQRPALPGTPAGWCGGLGLAADGTAVAGVADRAGLRIYLRTPGGRVTPVGRVPGHRRVVDLAPCGRYLVTAPGATGWGGPVVRGADGAPVAHLADLTGVDGRRVRAAGFAGDVGFAGGGATARLLLVVEEPAGYHLAVWTPGGGLRHHHRCRFDTELTARWYPDGLRVLVHQERHAVSLLHEVDLAAGTVATLPTPRGSILDAAVWPDGDLAYLWSNHATPPRLCSTTGITLPDAAPTPARAAVAGAGQQGAVEAGQQGVVGAGQQGFVGAGRQGVVRHRRAEVWVPGPGGPVHTMLATPVQADGPLPAVFLVPAGGGTRDGHDPLVQILVSTGCAVVRAGVRGCRGYGPAWAAPDATGAGQLADLAAVRAWLVEHGVVDGRRVALWGHGPAGQLTLAALEAQPQLWRLGAAIDPGGGPTGRPVPGRAGSPASSPAVSPHASPALGPAGGPGGGLGSAPVFVALASGDGDPATEPVLRHVQRLRQRRVAVQLVRHRGGRGQFDARTHPDLVQAVLLFLQRHLDAARPGNRLPATAGAW